MAGQIRTRTRRLGALVALTAATAAMAAVIPGGAGVAPAPAFAQGCSHPDQISPGGPLEQRFTMLLRVNQLVNVDAWTSSDETLGGLKDYVRKQDIFVINTRFEGSTPTEWSQMATQLRKAFPCNRIAALNGMGVDPDRPGYAYALINHPAVYALMTDFEPMDWDDDPARPGWSFKPNLAMKRIKRQNTRLASAIASSKSGAAKRSGLVPLDWPGWNYGEIAQDLDKKNRRLGGRKLGPLSVQTQDSCANGGASTFRERTKPLFGQYRFRVTIKTVKRSVKGKTKKRKIRVKRPIKKRARPLLSNLSLQISFSDTPNPRAGMAITKTSAKTAAACTQAGLKRGAGAFFYFASTNSMQLLFRQKQIAKLRPPKNGNGSSGGVGAPG
jgi:hypothetical protein